MDAKILLGSSIITKPIRNTYQIITSQKKSMYCLSFRSMYPFSASPMNRWITPNSIAYIRRRIGSFSGTNQAALISPPSGTSTWKKVRATTSTASPKYPPKSTPHTKVERPQYINIFSALCMPWLMRGYFLSTIKHARNIISPYAASDSIRPKKTHERM